MNLFRRVPFLREVALLARRFANAVLDDEDAAFVGQTDFPEAPETDEPPARQGPPAHWIADIAAKAPHLVQNGEILADAFSNFDLRSPVIETESTESQREEKRAETPKGVTPRREHAAIQRKNDPPRQTDVRPERREAPGLVKEADVTKGASTPPRGCPSETTAKLEFVHPGRVRFRGVAAPRTRPLRGLKQRGPAANAAESNHSLSYLDQRRNPDERAPSEDTSRPVFPPPRPPTEEKHLPRQERSSFPGNTPSTKELATKELATKELATKELATKESDEPKASPRVALPRPSNNPVQSSAPSTRSATFRENRLAHTVTPSFAPVRTDEPSVVPDKPHETNPSTETFTKTRSSNAPRNDRPKRFDAKAPTQEVVQDFERFSPIIDEAPQISRHVRPPSVFESSRMDEVPRMQQRLAERRVDTSNPHVAPELHQVEPPVLFAEPERDHWPALPSQEHFGATRPAFLDLEIFADRAARLDKEQRGDW